MLGTSCRKKGEFGGTKLPPMGPRPTGLEPPRKKRLCNTAKPLRFDGNLAYLGKSTLSRLSSATVAPAARLGPTAGARSERELDPDNPLSEYLRVGQIATISH